MSYAATPGRLDILDAIKALASNLIVLHHLAFYGPMAKSLDPLLPGLMTWLQEDARIAVQAFLVIGGFLAARSLAPQGIPGVRQPLRLLQRRYLKLAPPFIAAMAIAVLSSEIARGWMQHESISAPAQLTQFAAHALLLHDVLGFEALSAGAWYVAIDFQLYALMLSLLWAAGWRRSPWFAPMLVAAGGALSLWYFNVDSTWDIWAPYFFGSYALGAIAWWACSAKRGLTGALYLSALLIVLAGIALLIEFRSRIAVAASVALLLIAACRTSLNIPGVRSAASALLGRISYSVFLLHFPVCLLVNAAFTRFAPPSVWIQGAGVILAWGASLAAGYGFYHWIEAPLSGWARDSQARRERTAYLGNGKEA